MSWDNVLSYRQADAPPGKAIKIMRDYHKTARTMNPGDRGVFSSYTSFEQEDENGARDEFERITLGARRATMGPDKTSEPFDEIQVSVESYIHYRKTNRSRTNLSSLILSPQQATYLMRSILTDEELRTAANLGSIKNMEKP